MAYTKTVWVDGGAPAISAANLGHLEQGVFDVDAASVKTGGGSTVAPSASQTFGLQMISPAFADSTHQLQLLTDSAQPTNAGTMLNLQHGGQGYAIDLLNLVGANSAQAIHQYSSATPAVIWDNTGSATLLKMRNTENPAAAPGSSGTGNFIDLFGYNGVTSYADGVVSGGTNLQSTLCTFTASDVNKPITVAGVAKTIAARIDAHNVTLNTAATNGSGITFSFAQLANVALLGSLLSQFGSLIFASQGQPWLFQGPGAGTNKVMQVQQPGGTGTALEIDNAGGGIGFYLHQTGVETAPPFQVDTASSVGLFLGTFNNAAGAYGVQFLTTTNGGQTIDIEKNGTGAGDALLVTNKGTGAGVRINNGVADVFTISAAGGVGLYGHAAPAQPARAVTLADVIAVLAGCGLTA